LERHNEHLLQIFNTAINAVQPGTLIPAFFKKEKLHLEKFHNIFVAGAGKATAAMAQEIEKILGSRIKEGVIAVKHGHSLPLKYTRQIEAGHPLPDENSITAANEIIKLFKKAVPGDLIIFLLSGGASSLITDLPPGMSLQEYNSTVDKLLKSGASIAELNAVRKQLSAIKGGRLIKYANGAEIISLIISDVPGDDLSVIGSGPTVPTQGEQFTNVHNYLIGNNELALRAAGEKAKQLGYTVEIYPEFLTGDAAETASKWINEIVTKENKYCLIAGGETTVTVKGSGLGGRNQHFALAAAKHLIHHNNITLLAAGTDGTDGPTDATGAIVDSTTWSREAEDHFLENDSYNFFAQNDRQIKTGPTQTNVMDITIALVN
jgi:glycerate 2-kinase